MNKRLSELVDVDKVVALLKFSKREHLERLQKGSLYLNNFQYYKDLVLEEKRKGQGDAHDLTVLLSNVDFKIKNNRTGEVAAVDSVMLP